ncbi:hypothetical protein DDJ39_07600 [Mycobacteroides abscessus]|nr:hypothetical protein DDJ39_07600 [Mycobacteroides abscessus]
MVGSTGPRLIPTAASFWWASRELATLIARHTPDNILTEADVTELADYVDRTTSTALWRQGQCDIATLSPAARRIAGSCSYGYGSQAGKPFQKMLVQRDIELHPFVDVDGVMIPAALQKIHEGFHVALFHALRKQHKHTVDTAQLFELVCRDTLARLFSQSTTILPDRMHIYDSCGVQLGETDFAIAHGSVLILGEVKSKAAPGEVLMNGERFTDQITETIKQLDKAVDNLTNNGATLVANGQRVDTEGISTFIGIAVVLHDYGGGIWQGKVLHEVRQGRRGFAILRAVDLMLLAHTLRDMDELIDYLSFRQEFMDCYGFSVDEVDILAAFLGNARRYRHFFRQVNLVHKNVIPLPPRDVERELLISPTPPARLGPWRATVANFTKTVANFNT